MFTDHQPIIETWAKDSPERTAHVIKFVLSTIRCHFEHVPRRLTKALDGNFTELTPAARLGFRYVDDNDMTVEQHECWSDEYLLRHYLDVPGLGIVKAGFAVTLLHGRSGCLDVHNLRIYGFDAKTFQRPSTTGALRKRLELYTKTIELIGGSETIWNRWCTEIYRLRPKKWTSPNAVSTAHVDFILDTYRGE